ncbi:hypothetical protein BDV18DRAFT_149860 [Aspergillus unguis]
MAHVHTSHFFDNESTDQLGLKEYFDPKLNIWKPSTNDNGTAQTQSDGQKRCIVQAMEAEDKNCVIFFGSQTGNGQDFAERLAKEAHSRFGLNAIAADLQDYDYETLVKFPDDKIALFILSSYGEGEPTDNAVGFFDFITSDEPAFAEDKDSPLQSMKYAAFGLGNSTYEHFNGVVRKVDDCLQRLGATPITGRGEGDDGQGTQEDDFLTWKEVMWESLKTHMGLEEQSGNFEPSFCIDEKPATAESIYLGERCKDELTGSSTEHGPQSPFIAKVLHSRELFKDSQRNCLHVDIDLRGSGLAYETGDHVAVWPSNSDVEVDRFLRVFGLIDKRHNTVHISAVDSSTHVHLPSPTTYDAAVRYYMEICGPISRQFLGTLALFAPHRQQKETLEQLSKDREAFGERISSKLLNLAKFIETIQPDNPVCPIPFEVLVEGLRPLQPRYYSISSSSLLQTDSVSLTTVVDSVELGQHCFKGVASNYLMALKRIQNQEPQSDSDSAYAVTGPRNKYEMSLPIHIRHSSFKLPRDHSTPIVMIGAGTGVAPFRAFVQERAKQAEAGVAVGDMLLFFGCRQEQEDFIYQDEWENFKSILGNKFQLYTAFSRPPNGKKYYVQHRLAEHEAELQSLLLQQNGHLYVCGSARMARDVQNTLGGLLSQPLCNGETAIHQMKSAAKYQEDVW